MRFDNPFTKEDEIRGDWDAITPRLYADAAYEGIRATHTFQKFYLEPLLLHGLITPSRREQVLIELHYRMVAYLSSFRKLNGPQYFQTLAASARSLFELGLDMVLLSLDSTDESIDRLDAFTKVERYRVAKKTVDYFSNHPLPKGQDISAQRLVCSSPNVKSEMESLLDRYWPSAKRTYPNHWSKFQDARSRARHVGTKWEERYVLTNYIFSWHVHSGLAGVSGLNENTFHAFVMEAFQLSYDVVLDCLRILGQEFHLPKVMPEWADRLSFLERIILLALIDKTLIALGEPSRLVYLEEQEQNFSKLLF